MNYHLVGTLQTEEGHLVEVYRCEGCGTAVVEYYSVATQAGRDVHNLLHETRRDRRRRRRAERPRTVGWDYP